MKISELLTEAAVEVWKFNYNSKYREVLVLDVYPHKTTGRLLVAGIDLSLVPRNQLELLKQQIPLLNDLSSSNDRYDFIKYSLPEELKHSYKTFDLSKATLLKRTAVNVRAEPKQEQPEQEQPEQEQPEQEQPNDQELQNMAGEKS